MRPTKESGRPPAPPTSSTVGIWGCLLNCLVVWDRPPYPPAPLTHHKQHTVAMVGVGCLVCDVAVWCGIDPPTHLPHSHTTSSTHFLCGWKRERVWWREWVNGGESVARRARVGEPPTPPHPPPPQTAGRAPSGGENPGSWPGAPALNVAPLPPLIVSGRIKHS